MFYQIDKRIRVESRDDECYWFCLLQIHEDFGRHEFTVEQLEKMHDLLVRIGYLRMDGLVIDVPGIAQVASAVSGRHVFMNLVDPGQEYTALIARYSRPGMTHFVRVDVIDKVKIIYDPYSPAGSKTVREGVRSGYRYIFAEAI